MYVVDELYEVDEVFFDELVDLCIGVVVLDIGDYWYVVYDVV